MIRAEANRGRDWVLDADVSDCFGSIDHEALMTQVGRRVSDRAMQLSPARADRNAAGQLCAGAAGT